MVVIHLSVLQNKDVLVGIQPVGMEFERRSFLYFFSLVARIGAQRIGPIFLLIFLIACFACAPIKPPKRGAVLSPAAVRALKDFEKAEQLFRDKSYLESLSIYGDYLKRFPKGELADRALMESGLIHAAAGDYPKARDAFEKLLSRFPRSPFADDARFNIALAYYSEGDSETAITFGCSALKLARTASQRFRIHRILGFAYSANGQFEKSISSFMAAYAEGSAEEKAKIISTVKEVITSLGVPQLERLLDLFKDRVPGGYLRLELARQYAAEDRVDEAIDVLSDLVVLFPHHEEMNTAVTLMEELESRSIVNPYLIGCVLPLSGTYAEFGARALSGIELAIDQVNKRSDMHPVELVIKDSGGDPSQAVSAVESLALKDGAIAILGPMITAEPGAVRAQALKLPVLTLTQKPNITNTGDYVFRDFLTADLQARSIVDYAVRDLGIERFAIFYPDEPYGMSFMNRFWDELIRHDAEVVGVESYAPNQTDFGDAIKKLVGLYYDRPETPSEEKVLVDDLAIWDKFLEHEKDQMESPTSTQDNALPYDMPPDQNHQNGDKDEEGPRPIVDFEAIFIPDSYEKVGLITPQLLYHDIEDILLLGSNLWHSKKLIQMAGGYVQGAVVPDGFFVNSPSLVVRNFVRCYGDVFGRSPSFLEAQAYDAAMIVFQAVNDPGVTSRRTLKMALMQTREFQGVTGLTSFDETGDAQKELYLLTVKGRSFVQIRP